MQTLNFNEVRSIIEGDSSNNPFMDKPIGEVNFHGEFFKKEVNFKGAIFKEFVNFGNSRFWENADFTGAIFEKGVNFHNSKFRKPIQFSYCKFLNYVSFWKCCFEDGADFTEIGVYPLLNPIPSPFQPGEANFSWCCFKGDTILNRAQFFGPAYFWRTHFSSKVDFADSRFYSRAWFNGNRTEIQFDRGVFSDPDLCDKLIDAGILRISEDGRRKEGDKIHFDNVLFKNIISEEDLRSKLKTLIEPAIRLQDEETLRNIWINEAKEMFAEPKKVTFRSASFEDKRDTKFIDVKFDIERSIRDAGIFISYNHKDQKWLNLIVENIKFIETDHGYEIWKDEDIKAGHDWDKVIKETIERSKVALLLVTRAFLESKYIMEIELPLMKAASDTLTIFWVPIEEVKYDFLPFSGFQSALPIKKPLETLSQEELSKSLKKIAEKLVQTLGVSIS